MLTTALAGSVANPEDFGLQQISYRFPLPHGQAFVGFGLGLDFGRR
jgi:hypothetical protein